MPALRKRGNPYVQAARYTRALYTVRTAAAVGTQYAARKISARDFNLHPARAVYIYFNPGIARNFQCRGRRRNRTVRRNFQEGRFAGVPVRNARLAGVGA